MFKKFKPFGEKLVEEIKNEMTREIERLLNDDSTMSYRDFHNTVTVCPYTYMEIIEKWELYKDDYYHMYEYISDYILTSKEEDKILEEAYSTITEENDSNNPPVLFVLVISYMIKKMLMSEIVNTNLSKIEMEVTKDKIKDIDIFKEEHGDI